MTQPERTVGIEDIFFSTTDPKGVITSANRVFSEIAQYEFEELVGAPHSIIRHEEMPGAVFHLMWERLQDNKPVVAYVKNQTKDGLFYWVFATVTPIPEGYLSVRTKPTVMPLFEATKSLYEQIRPFEYQAVSDGLKRREAAAAGEEELVSGLQSMGLANYEDYMVKMLAAEVATRAKLSSSPQVNAQPGTALGAIVGGSQMLEIRLRELLAQVEALGILTDQLHEATSSNVETSVQLARTASEAVETAQNIEGLPPALLVGAQGIKQWVEQAVQSLTALSEDVPATTSGFADAQFAITLAHLHNEMVMSFANEVAGGQSPQKTVEFIPLLCETIVGDIQTMSAQLQTLSNHLNAILSSLQNAFQSLQDARTYMASWQLQVRRYNIVSISDAAEQIATLQTALLEHVRVLAQLASQCMQLLGQIQPDLALEPLPVIQAGAAAFNS